MYELEFGWGKSVMGKPPAPSTFQHLIPEK